MPSVKLIVISVADVKPGPIVTGPVTEVEPAAANAAGAATVAKSEASSAALMPTLIAFLNLFKSCTSLNGLD